MRRFAFRPTMLSTMFAVLAGCSISATAQPDLPATPAVVIFGSCPQKPVWPEAAQRDGREGKVGLAFQIDVDSKVLDAQIKRSSGHADLDEAARVGIAKCKFKAATANGNPVRGWAELDYVWILPDASPRP